MQLKCTVISDTYYRRKLNKNRWYDKDYKYNTGKLQIEKGLYLSHER